MKDPKKVKQGKRNRINGADFEKRVRKDLIEKGWNVSKYQNNLKYPKENINKLMEEKKDYKSVPAMPSRFRLSSTGFPDFICYKPYLDINGLYAYRIMFVECKINGYLSKEEKSKAKWYLKNSYCTKFFVASKEKIKNKIHIRYVEFKT